MIQRIQSLYLSLTIILTILFLKGSFLTFINNTGSVINITFRGIVSVTGGENSNFIEILWPLSAIIIAISALSLITIFLYKNRKVQMWFAAILIIMATGLILMSAYYSYKVITGYGVSITVGLNMFIPVVILALSIMAYIGIRKDDRLVKSYDRLR